MAVDAAEDADVPRDAEAKDEIEIEVLALLETAMAELLDARNVEVIAVDTRLVAEVIESVVTLKERVTAGRCSPLQQRRQSSRRRLRRPTKLRARRSTTTRSPSLSWPGPPAN